MCTRKYIRQDLSKGDQLPKQPARISLQIKFTTHVNRVLHNFKKALICKESPYMQKKLYVISEKPPIRTT